MRDVHAPAALRAALQFLMTSDIPSEHKVVLIETLTQALRNDQAAQIQQHADEEKEKEKAKVWQPDETAQLESLLGGRVASSWQHADELLMRAATQLERSPSDVRAKATEIGLGAGVDYRLARARATEG